MCTPRPEQSLFLYICVCPESRWINQDTFDLFWRFRYFNSCCMRLSGVLHLYVLHCAFCVCAKCCSLWVLCYVRCTLCCVFICLRFKLCLMHVVICDLCCACRALYLRAVFVCVLCVVLCVLHVALCVFRFAFCVAFCVMRFVMCPMCVSMLSFVLCVCAVCTILSPP